jgi:hypothetical protein
MGLIPTESEHQINTTFFIDPASLAMLGALILMLMAFDKVLTKVILK